MINFFQHKTCQNMIQSIAIIALILSKMVRWTVLWSTREKPGFYGLRFEKVWETLNYILSDSVLPIQTFVAVLLLSDRFKIKSIALG